MRPSVFRIVDGCPSDWLESQAPARPEVGARAKAAPLCFAATSPSTCLAGGLNLLHVIV
jgi:hypothetical protein